MNSLQLDIPEPYRSQILDFANTSVAPEDVLELEERPHITLIYGFQNNIEEIKEIIGKFGEIDLQFGATKLFMAGDYCENDILFIEVFSKKLKELRDKLINKIEYDRTYTTYTPHVTLYKMKRGHAMYYIGSNPVVGEKLTINELIFSTPDGKEVISGL